MNYSSVAGAMRLTGPITSGATLITVDTVTGLPASVPFKLTIDGGLVNEEIVKVTNVSGTNLTVARGWDGSAAVAHANQASVRHMATAEDLRLSRQHEGLTSGVHGATSNVVGVSDTQGLTNKSFSLGNNTFTGTKAQFQTAMTDDDFATLQGAQTLLDKTFSPSANTLPALTAMGATGGGTTDLFQIKDGTGALVASVDYAGGLHSPTINTINSNISANSTNITNLTSTVNANATNARNVNDGTYGLIPKSIAGSAVPTVAAGTGTVSMPFGITIAGAEKYAYVVQNGDYGAQPDLNVNATSPVGSGSQTALTVRYTGALAGGARMTWLAIYRDI